MARMIHASEAGRFYSKGAEPILEVPMVSKPGETRPPTISDAIKCGWLPSVTEVIKSMSKSSLEAWKLDHMLDVVLAFPFTEGQGEDLELWDAAIMEKADQWKKMISGKSDEYASAAAERGKEIHKNVEEFFLSGRTVKPADPASEVAANCIADLYGKLNIFPSFRFANLRRGYAGEIDLLACDETDVETSTIVRLGDIKTKELSKFQKPTIDNGYQLGAYRQAILDDYPGVKRVMLDQIIVDRDSGTTILYEWGEKWKKTQSQTPEQLSIGFLHLLGSWFISNNYDPRKG